MKRVIKGLTLCGLWALVLLPAGPAHAQIPTYLNNAIVTYPGTLPYLPVIDATNFINNSIFSVNFTSGGTPYVTLYETWDTLNYTNYGTLMANTGFQFDTQSSSTYLRSRAASFYNPGQIFCASVQDTTDPYGGALASEGYAQCIVNATNILNPGSVDAGMNGLIEFTGKNVDLSRSVLTIEGGGANVAGAGSAGLNTNYWDPSIYLGPTYAYSSPPIGLYLTNSTAYMNLGNGPGGTNVVRAVFIEDTSGSNVTVSVYFDTAELALFGIGNVTIQWAGSYLDPASGNMYTNYIYLNDDFVLGASTNVAFNNNGVPDNFTITESTVPLDLSALTPAPPGFLPVFFSGTVTNRYDYAAMNLLASFSTNNIANQSITNLPGRVEISGDSFLNLSNAEITGQSYTSLVATNVFAGSGGALIQTPYSDLNLGTTNGVLYVTNTMETYIPIWGGTCQAWNTRFIGEDTNPADLLPGTNDYRVLIIHSQFTPTTTAQVQNLILHDYQSNNIIISDTFDVMRSFYADAQSLTLTTNVVGDGATSFDGELNLGSVNIFWQQSVPNLRYLTNDGAIRMQNLAYYGYPVLTNVNPPVAASGMLSEIGTNVVRKDKVTIGSTAYMFVTKLTNTVADQVLIATNMPAPLDASLSNLIAAINGAAGAGTVYSTATKSNSQVTAGSLVAGAFTVTARTTGTAGNSISTLFTPATASVNLSWGGHSTLYGGASATTNNVSYLGNSALINNGIFTDQGSIIYAGNFESGDIFSNGIGSFTLQSLTTTLTNGAFYADGDVSITASVMLTSNLLLQADRSLTLQVTNQLFDTGPSPTNNNIWSVGSVSVGSGFNLPIKPALGDLLGTTITLAAPAHENVLNTWAGTDRGLSTAGYTNNEAIGQLILNVSPSTVGGHNGELTFNGASVSNALYIDALVLTNFATQGNATNQYNFPWLSIGNNMMIYFAQAWENGHSVAEAIDNASRNGANGGRLRWVYDYAGYYSSTNLVYTNRFGLPVTNAVNAALAQSTVIDSDSDGIPNALDPTPFFERSEIDLKVTVTNRPPLSAMVRWTTIPNATNFIYFATNIPTTNWLPFTNFNNWYYGNNVAVTNYAHSNYFRSPQVYINDASLPDNSQQTNVWVYDAITNMPHYYKVVVWPWVNFPE